MYDDNPYPVIAVILYSYTHGSVVAEYNLDYEHKNKNSQHLLLCKIIIITR